MKTNDVTKIINSDWNMYTITDPGNLPALPFDIKAAENGLARAQAASYVTVTTGTYFGPVRVTIAIHDGAPEPELADWTDVVELPFVVASGQMAFVDWDGAAFYRADLPPGPWRLRVHARGRDEGAAGNWEPFDPEEGPEEEPAEEHLLQLFPGEGGEVVYKTEDAFGGRGRGSTQPEPAPEPAPEPLAPAPTIHEVMRQVIENFPRRPRQPPGTASSPDAEVTNLHSPLRDLPEPTEPGRTCPEGPVG
jgi:hypothetical protein